MELKIEFYNIDNIIISKITIELPNNKVGVSDLIRKTKQYSPINADYFIIKNSNKIKSFRIPAI
jgi:hypothetical protein